MVVLAGIVIVVIAALIGFCVWALREMKAGYLHVQGAVEGLIRFSIEMRGPDVPEKPRDEPRS